MHSKLKKLVSNTFALSYRYIVENYTTIAFILLKIYELVISYY